MTHSRRHALAAPLLALSVALLASAGSAGAQSPPPQTATTADKPTTADADKAARDAAAKAEAERKAEARKPRADAKGDRKPPEREIEEEEAP
ncbi:MAG: hypothetical protein JF600_01235 [Xanthomonadales bacterium]|nr:hypothetical protein [Xanthomonadales bacterium]